MKQDPVLKPSIQRLSYVNGIRASALIARKQCRSVQGVAPPGVVTAPPGVLIAVMNLWMGSRFLTGHEVNGWRFDLNSILLIGKRYDKRN